MKWYRATTLRQALVKHIWLLQWIITTITFSMIKSLGVLECFQGVLLHLEYAIGWCQLSDVGKFLYWFPEQEVPCLILSEDDEWYFVAVCDYAENVLERSTVRVTKAIILDIVADRSQEMVLAPEASRAKHE
jgi:hypothetical protein